MHIRAIALAIPLVMGIAACKTSSTQSGETASTSQPRSDQETSTASSGTHTGTDSGATASGSATSTGTPGIGGDATASGTTGGAYGTGSTSPGTMSGATDDLKGHASDELVSGKVMKVSQSEIAIESAQGDRKTLQVVPETVVMIDGREARSSELQEGQQVRASFNTVEGQDVAVQIEAGRDLGSTGTGAMPGGTTGTMDPGSSGTTDPGSSGTSYPGSTGTMDPGSSGTSDPGTSGTSSDPLGK